MQDLIRPDASFTPRELFTRMQGAWLEPRLGSMWQENTGVTPTTSAGQTVGLLLGLDQNQQLGPRLETNGEFDTNVNDWTIHVSANTQIAWENGAMRLTPLNSTARVYQGISTIPGRLYKCEAYLSSSNSNPAYFAILSAIVSTIQSINTTNQTLTKLTQYFIAIGTTTYIAFNTSGTSNTALIDNVSVREILGNHASQATAANRPTLQYNGNLPLIRFDSNRVLTASLPNLGSGVFSSAGSVYFATPQGMSALHSQSIGTTYTLPAPNSSIYGWCVFPARLPPPLEQRLALYMHRLAGLSDADFFWQEQATDDMTGQLLADDNDTILLRA